MKNKIITIYDLITLIKENKAPKKICYQGNYLEFDGEDYKYYEGADTISDDSLVKYIAVGNLKDTVEILPEENDEWEDIYTLGDIEEYHFMNRQNGMTKEDRRLLDSNFKTLVETINKIIKNQKHLKERLDNVKDDVVFDYWKDKVVGKDE